MEPSSVKGTEEQKAELMIIEYLKAHPGPSFASEIADALGLEFGVTFGTVNKLLQKGRVKKAKQ